MDQELKTALDELKASMEAAVTEKAKQEIADQIKALTPKPEDQTWKKDIEDIKNWQVKKDEADKANQAALDIIAAERKNIKVPHLGGEFPKESFKEALTKGLNEKAEQLKNYKNTRQGIDIQMKTVGDIAAANFTTSGTVTFNGPQMLPGVYGPAYRRTRMRDILGTTPVSTDSVSVIRAVAGEGGPTGVAAGAVKPQSDRDWVKVIIPITKIAHYYTIPEEWLEDTAWLSADITETGINDLMNVEDNKIISNVTAGEFGGLVQNSTAYASPTGLALGIEAANNYDVLVAAMTQLRNLNRDPNFIVTDNDAYARMILTKATTGEYVFGAPNVSIPNVFGVPIYPMTVTALADKFIVGDRSQATVAVRSGVSVRFYDQHANNAIYNLVTVVIEERIALVVKNVAGFIYGDFSDSRAALETA